MSTPLILAVKTIGLSKQGGHAPCTLIKAGRHNLREIQAERGFESRIDWARTPRNQVLHGPVTAKAVQTRAQELIVRYGVPKSKLRRDYVQAIEFVISIPPNSSIDAEAFFQAGRDWLVQEFGEEMLLSAVIHLDEAAPHMHALVLPIIDGVYKGGAPIKPSKLRMLIKAFAQGVGHPFGLSLEPKAKLRPVVRHAIAQAVVDRLVSSADPVVTSPLWPLVRDAIQQSPQQFVEALAIELPKTAPKKKVRTLAQIMTGRGRRTSEDGGQCQKQLQSCVGFARAAGSSTDKGLVA